MTAAAHATAPPASASPEAIAAALHRLDLAAVRRRAVVARGLDLSGVELLAIEHVERAGALSPGELSACLQLSSGGTTKLIQRLQRTGHLSRSPDGTDGRRAYVRVAPAARRSIAARHAALTEAVAAAVARLPHEHRSAVHDVVMAVLSATEGRTEELVREAAAGARDVLVARPPVHWS
jgi:DNA-binding MarR family transcriptional regulator